MVTFREVEGLFLPSGATPASIIAANTSVTLYTPLIGQTCRLVKVHAINRTGGNGFLRFGRGNFVQIFPDILLINLVESILHEEDLIDYWWGGQGAVTPDPVVIQASVGAAAPTDVQVMATLEIRGS